MQTVILGISAFYHDSAACLVEDGRIISAAQEERFTRKKHDFSFPKNAISYCLQDGGLKSNDLDFVAFYDKPFIHIFCLIHNGIALMNDWMPNGANVRYVSSILSNLMNGLS